MADGAGTPQRRARWVVFGAVVVTGLLYAVPYGWVVGYPLILLSTYAHEMGHGLAGVFVGGTFVQFVMHFDGSGAAQISHGGGRLAAGAISAGGLVGPAVLGALFFVASSRVKVARIALLVFGAAMLFSCLWVVRSVFGWVFVGSLGALFAFIGAKASARLSQAALAFLAAQLTLSVFSRGDYLFMEYASVADGTQRLPSDVSNMANALFLPYWFWGAVCGLFSLLVLAGGLWAFWRATRPEKTALESRLEALSRSSTT